MPTKWISSEADFVVKKTLEVFEAATGSKLTYSQAIVLLFKSWDFPGLLSVELPKGDENQ